MPLDLATRAAIADNLFPAAHSAIRNWDEFPWHCDRTRRPTTHRRWSSQALALDVFGTIAGLKSQDDILDAVMADLKICATGPWRITPEWKDEGNSLKEPRPTQVDAAAEGADSLVLFECKFTEQSAGTCSQPRPLAKGSKKGLKQCTGAYELQTNPVNGVQARCALSGKRIEYWQWVPKVLGVDANRDYPKCPFAGSFFQWMRNAVLAAAVASSAKLQPIFVVVHAGSAGDVDFPVARELATETWRAFEQQVNSGPVVLRTVSYQGLLECALAAAARSDVATLLALKTWVLSKEQDARLRRHGSDGG